MELTLNFEDLSKLTLRNEFGEIFKIVPYEPDPFGEYLTRTEVRKEFRVGDETITRWISEGLVVIDDNGRDRFDRRDIDEYFETKKSRGRRR